MGKKTLNSFNIFDFVFTSEWEAMKTFKIEILKHTFQNGNRPVVYRNGRMYRKQNVRIEKQYISADVLFTLSGGKQLKFHRSRVTRRSNEKSWKHKPLNLNVSPVITSVTNSKYKILRVYMVWWQKYDVDLWVFESWISQATVLSARLNTFNDAEVWSFLRGCLKHTRISVVKSGPLEINSQQKLFLTKEKKNV